jgi:hypothetical protein
VKQNDLGEYDKNARQKQNIQVYRAKAPQTKPYGWQTPIPPSPQISKLRRIKGFGENVGQLSLGVYIPHLNAPFST